MNELDRIQSITRISEPGFTRAAGIHNSNRCSTRLLTFIKYFIFFQSTVKNLGKPFIFFFCCKHLLSHGVAGNFGWKKIRLNSSGVNNLNLFLILEPISADSLMGSLSCVHFRWVLYCQALLLMSQSWKIIKGDTKHESLYRDGDHDLLPTPKSPDTLLSRSSS